MDKDILIKGNKIYSPDTFCFVPQEINLAVMVRKRNHKKEIPIGVIPYKEGYRVNLKSYIKNKYFESIEDVKQSYICAKKQYKDKISEKVYNSIITYPV